MLYNDDCIKIMMEINSNSVDLIFADPPYFLSNDGITFKNGRIQSVNKGDWDKKENYTDVYEFTNSWIKECKRILNINGTLWITGTKHNFFDIYKILTENKFKINNIIIGKKQILRHSFLKISLNFLMNL